jgi:hypothetical protein
MILECINASAYKTVAMWLVHARGGGCAEKARQHAVFAEASTNADGGEDGIRTHDTALDRITV